MKTLTSTLITVSMATTGCSTVLETMNGDSLTYRRTKDSSGNTKYVRSRLLDTSSPSSATPTYYGNPYSYDYGVGTSPDPLPQTIDALANIISTATQATVTHVASDYNASDNSDLYHDAVAAIETSSPSTNDNPFRGGGIAFSISRSKDTANGDMSYEWMSEYLSGGAGVSFVSSDRTYFGFNGQVRIHYPWVVSPFVGVGAYLGDSKSCDYTPASNALTQETCEKYYLSAVTADLGLQFNFDKNFVMRTYARGFSQTRQGDPLGDTLYGTSFAFVF